MSLHADQIRARWNGWHPSRLLVIEEWVLCASIVAVGLVYAFICLPKPSVPVAVARSMHAVKSPFFKSATTEPVVSLVPASRAMIDRIGQAQRLENRGIFDATTREAWKAAAAELHRFAFMPISTGPRSHVRLFMKEAEEDRMVAIEGLLEDLLPGQFAALVAKRDAAIAADASRGASMPEVTWFIVAASAPEEARDMAFDLAFLREEARTNAITIGRYRDLVGYDYWRAVCDAGASEPGFQARADLWRAEYDARQAQFELAKATYEQAFRSWHDACKLVPTLETNARAVEDMATHRARYEDVLTALHEPGGVEAAIEL